jgi:hypothetical protein
MGGVGEVEANYVINIKLYVFTGCHKSNITVLTQVVSCYGQWFFEGLWGCLHSNWCYDLCAKVLVRDVNSVSTMVITRWNNFKHDV